MLLHSQAADHEMRYQVMCQNRHRIPQRPFQT
jgi:hypothetical protein